MSTTSNLKNYPGRTFSNNVYETKVVDLDQLNELMSSKILENKNNYLFRGQRRSGWGLKPTLYRGDALEYIFINESAALAKFKRNLLGRRGDNPRTLNDDELYSLGQHFGLKTPLLDWSNSIYVALFFAFAEDKPNPTETRVIYGIHRQRLEEHSKNKKNFPIKFIEPQIDENKRLISQNGAFTFFSQNVEIESWIRQLNYPNKNKFLLLKLYVENKSREKILKQLNWMNINYLSLFPDVYGAALHTNLQIEISGY
jgi:hypothetical protein